MTFATPIWLAAAAAVIVPILIHLFGRPRPRLHRFPSLMLLRRAQRERRSTTRLRRIVSLILRCLALLLLALVLAGPLTDRPPLARLGEHPGATAIILDRSPSMSAATVAPAPIDRARDAAGAVLEALPAAEDVLLSVGQEEPLVMRAGDAQSVIEAVNVDDMRGRLANDLATLIDGERALSRVFLLTDLQATSLSALPSTDPTEARIIAVDVGAEIERNSALTDLSANASVHLRGRPIDLTASAQTWGPGRGRVPITLNCGGAERTAGIDLLPDARTSATLEVVPNDAGTLTCTARLPEDALGRDDQRVFAARVRDRLRIVVIGEGAQTRFLEAALDPWPAGDARSVVEVVGAEALETTADADAVFVATPDLDDAALEALRARAESGTGVLLFATASEALLEALGFDGVTIGNPVRREDGAALAEISVERAFLAAFAHPGMGDLSAARFSVRPDVQISEETAATVLVRYDDGTPALVEGAIERGRTLLFATSPDDAWSDLVRMPEFVPLMHRLALHLAAGTEPAILAGSPGEATVGTLSGDSDDLRVVGGNGTGAAVDVRDGRWKHTAPGVGAFRLQSGEEDIAAFAVNLDNAESNPARLSADEVRERLRPLVAKVVSAGDLPAFLEQMGPGLADVSSLVALLALLVLAVESVQSLQPRGSSDDER